MHHEEQKFLPLIQFGIGMALGGLAILGVFFWKKSRTAHLRLLPNA